MNYSFAFVELSKWDFGAFRILGPGLGNLLFPWARAIVASKVYDLEPIWPTWPQLKFGPLARREQDLRFYTGLFHNPGHYVDGAKKAWLMAVGCRSNETNLVRIENIRRCIRPQVITFRGMKGLFEPILEYREYVRNELLLMSRSDHQKGMAHDFSESICVHLRRGDFLSSNEGRLREGHRNIRLPLSWVAETIQLLRQSLGKKWPVWLFSDGRDADLVEILEIPEVRRIHFGSALADMIAMSRSNVLVVSSTFSMWSSYLGAVPSIYYPGQFRQRLHPKGAR